MSLTRTVLVFFMMIFIKFSYSLREKSYKTDIDPKIVQIPGTKQLEVIYFFKNQNHVLELNLEEESFIPKGHFLSYQQSNGTRITKFYTKNDIQLCQYRVSSFY